MQHVEAAEKERWGREREREIPASAYIPKDYPYGKPALDLNWGESTDSSPVIKQLQSVRVHACARVSVRAPSVVETGPSRCTCSTHPRLSPTQIL